ncbi:MAG: hypothetical protein WD873_03685, partial [Candidatus Hydrogenedentales bacterium]
MHAITRRQAALGMLALVAACLFSPAAEPSGLEWSTLPPLPVAVAGQFAGVNNGALIVAGGASFSVPPWEGGKKEWHDAVWVLLRGDDAWRVGGILPHSLAYGASVSTPDGVIIAGGSDGARHFAHTWRLRWTGEAVAVDLLPDLPAPAAYCAGSLLNGVMYVIGGQTAPDSLSGSNAFYRLDRGATEPRWQTLEPLPGPARILPVAAAQAGSIYVFGGANLVAGANGAAVRTYLNDGYRYTPGA